MERLVLWGHRLEEYREMFDLPDAALSMRFLEFQSGPSAFQSELRQQAGHLLSYDDWFHLDTASIKDQIDASFSKRLTQITQHAAEFDFSRYGDLQQLVDYRRHGIAKFLKDYDQGQAEGRYVSAQSKPLPFADFFFDFALSAHHFFSTVVPQNIGYHVDLIKELARVAKDVRIFPLVDAEGNPSQLLGPVILALQQENYGIEVRNVAYHLQPQGHAMLRIWAQQCQV